MLGRDRPGSCRVEEWPFEMCPEHEGPAVRTLILHRSGYRTEGDRGTLLGIGGEGGQESSDAAAGQERGERSDLPRVCIGAARAVDVQIDETGEERQPAEIIDRTTLLSGACAEMHDASLRHTERGIIHDSLRCNYAAANQRSSVPRSYQRVPLRAQLTLLP